MATSYSNELDPVLNASTVPAEKVEGDVYRARIRRYRATITLASQVSGEVIYLAVPKDAEKFMHGTIATSVTLGTATVKIGPISSDAAYRAAATFTVVDAPQHFGVTAAIASDPKTGGEAIVLTTGAAALPASGTLVVDLYFSGK